MRVIKLLSDAVRPGAVGACAALVLLASPGCELPLSGLAILEAEVEPSLICPGEETIVSWTVPDDGTCESCDPSIRVSPGEPAPPQSRSGSVTRTPSGDATYTVRGNVCQESNCRSMTQTVAVEVVHVPGSRTVTLPGTCGPRWSEAELRDEWSQCIEIAEVCNLTPRNAVTIFTVHPASGTIASARLEASGCTNAFAGRPERIRGSITDVSFMPTNFECGTLEGETSRNPPDIVLSLESGCLGPDECHDRP